MAKEIFDNDAYKLCVYMGLRRLDSTLPYVQAPYQKNLNKLYIRWIGFVRDVNQRLLNYYKRNNT